MASISDADRVRRLREIEKCNQEDMTNNAIAKKLSLPIETIQRCQKYLETLGQADITPEVLSKKRSELYLELVEATEEAKILFNLYKSPQSCMFCKGTGEITKTVKKEEVAVTCGFCKGNGLVHKTKDAERFLKAWVEVIEKKAKLYGLDNVKTETTFQQFNFDNREYVPDKMPGNLKSQTKRIADKIKESYEKKLKREHEISEEEV